jgi:hypothetical protein
MRFLSSINKEKDSRLFFLFTPKKIIIERAKKLTMMTLLGVVEFGDYLYRQMRCLEVRDATWSFSASATCTATSNWQHRHQHPRNELSLNLALIFSSFLVILAVDYLPILFSFLC